LLAWILVLQPCALSLAAAHLILVDMAITSQEWSAFLSNPLAVGIAVYLIIGIIVVGVVSFRGMRFRRPPNLGGPLWDEKDNIRNTLFSFLAIGKVHPIGFLIEILLWPLWLFLIIAFYEK
jgi:hypothetical protein